MRAHEKMLLNSKLMKAMPYLRHYSEGMGCALGMIEGPEVTCNGWSHEKSAEKIYPWLLDEVLPPCGCQIPGMWNGIQAITHLFNEHVCRDVDSGGLWMRGYTPIGELWTMERLADYIKAIDPTVDQGEELISEQEGVREYQKA